MELFTVLIDDARCDRCRACVPACPHGLIHMAERWQIAWLDCDGCGACVRACPREAIVVEPAVSGQQSAYQFKVQGSRFKVQSSQQSAVSDHSPLTTHHSPSSVLQAVEAVVARAKAGGLDAVVVASLTGSTAVLLARMLQGVPHRLVCVADTPDWVAFGHPYPTLNERHHRELRARGARVLRDYRSSSAGMPRYDAATGRDVPLSAAEAALFWEGVSAAGGEGMKTAIKSVVLATDHGLLRAGERVLSLGGSGGREAAVVMDAIGHAEILAGASGTRLRVREVLGVSVG